MNDPTHAALLHRLARLECVNHRWKLVAGMALSILGLMVLLGATKQKDATDPIGFGMYYDGNTYLSDRGSANRQLWELGYITGVLDAFSIHATHTPERDFAGDVSRCIRSRYQKRLLVGQAHAIVEHYLQSHPQHWDLSMPVLVHLAFAEVCRP